MGVWVRVIAPQYLGWVARLANDADDIARMVGQRRKHKRDLAALKLPLRAAAYSTSVLEC